MSWLRDPGGLITVDQAFSATDWKVLPGALSAGYTPDAVWLRLRIARLPDASMHWVLRFTNTLLDDVRLYRPNGAGGWIEQVSGENVPRSSWSTDTRYVAFPISLAAEGEETWLIRLRSTNAMSTSMEVWQRSAFDNDSRREYLTIGIYFGCYFLLILFHGFFWRFSREADSGWYLVYVVLNTSIELLTFALPQQVFDLPPSVSDTLLGIAICLSVPVGLRFSSLQLDLGNRFPRWSRAMLILGSAVAGAGILLILSGRYGTGVTIAQLAAMSMIVGFVTLACWLAARGYKPARFYLLAFGIFFVGVIISFLRNLTVLPYNVWTDNAAAAGTLIHMFLMSLRLAWSYRDLRAKKEQAQAQAAQAVQALNETLEIQVEQRTAALREEITQRARLEVTLRDALETERRIKEEQKDFVAMVSHEFRTPLAIIHTTVQQLGRNQQAPHERTLARYRNLRDAVRRMSALVDEYLTSDRMDAAATAFRPAPCDPRLLMEEILDEWPAGLIETRLGVFQEHIVCDKNLLKIAVRNLIANAERHCAPGSRIGFEAGMQDGGRFCISVTNRGELIPADEISSLFHKYFRGRAAQSKPGAGLGLYLVQRIMEMHQASVRHANDDGSGKVIFTLNIPADPAIARSCTVSPQAAFGASVSECAPEWNALQ